MLERRREKLITVAGKRQHSLHVVLENIHDPHNVSAIFRTCDAVGIPLVSLLYYVEKFPKIGKKSSASAFKWVDKRRFATVNECYQQLKSEGFSIYATTLDERAVSLYEIAFTEKTAIVFGNEHRGVSDEAIALADKTIYIPMQGMVQSLNVSVSAAVVLYEAPRQRYQAGMYEFDPEASSETEQLTQSFLKR